MYAINSIDNWKFQNTVDKFLKKTIDFHYYNNVIDLDGLCIKRNHTGNNALYDKTTKYGEPSAEYKYKDVSMFYRAVSHNVLARDYKECYYISYGYTPVGLFYLKYFSNYDDEKSVDILPIFDRDCDWFSMINEIIEYVKHLDKDIKFMVLDGDVMGYNEVIQTVLLPYKIKLECKLHLIFDCDKCIGTSSEHAVYMFSVRDYDYKKQIKVKFTIEKVQNRMSYIDYNHTEKKMEKDAGITFNLNGCIVKSDKSLELIFDKPIMYHPNGDDHFFEMSVNKKLFEPKDYYNKRLNKISKKYLYTDSFYNKGDPVHILYGLKFCKEEFDSFEEYKKSRSALGKFLLDFPSESYKKKLKTVKSKKINFPQLNWYNLYETFDIFNEDEKEEKVLEKSFIGLNIDYQVSYLYLLRKREFLNTRSPIYKIGRTTQIPDIKIGRFHNGYDKGSEICMIIQVPNDKVVDLERIIITKFNETFKNHIDGKEYFEGDMNLMIRIIFDTIYN